MGEVRMSEKESKFVYAMASAVHAQIDVTERQRAIVDATLKETREAAKQTSEAARLARKTTEELPLQILEAVDRVSEGVATRAASLLAEKFTQADAQAHQAAQRYERAARSLSWRLVASVSVFSAVLLASVTVVVLHVIPPAEEIRSLQETVDRLERRGGRALVVACPEEGKPKRLCVRIFDEQTNREGFRVIAGYQ